MASFEESYPAALNTDAERVTIEPDALSKLVTCVAALSTWPGADPVVPDTVEGLFRSASHGPAAFEALSEASRSAKSPAVRAAAERFAAQMQARSAAGPA